MTQDYISFIRSKVGHEKIFLNFAAGILTNDQGQVLLQLRGDKGTWGLIGGMQELGESSVDTLIREFCEETGISVEPLRMLNVYTNFEDSYPNGDVAQTTGILYEVRATKSYSIENFRNEETQALGFFSSEEIAELTIVNQQHELMLQEFFTNDFKIGN